MIIKFPVEVDIKIQFSLLSLEIDYWSGSKFFQYFLMIYSCSPCPNKTKCKKTWFYLFI